MEIYLKQKAYLLSITHNNQQTEHDFCVVPNKLICKSIKVTKLYHNSILEPASRHTLTTHINHKHKLPAAIRIEGLTTTSRGDDGVISAPTITP